MSLTIHSEYKYFDYTVQSAEDRRQKFHFCRLPFAVNVMLNPSIDSPHPIPKRPVDVNRKTSEYIDGHLDNLI